MLHSHTDFLGLRVAVTGGTSGLGLALVRQLAARGARVALVARTAEGVRETAWNASAVGIVGDVGKKADIYRIALQITGNLGGLDVLVNNASSLGPVPLAPLADTECEDLERALAVNLVGPFRLTKALYGALAASARDGRGAVVVNISSDAAVNAYPGWGAYGASKAALRHMTAIWAEEAGAGRRAPARDRPGRHGHPAARAGGSRRRRFRAQAPRGRRRRNHRDGARRPAGPRRGFPRSAPLTATDRPDRRSARLFTLGADGGSRHLPRTDLARLFRPGDLVVANDAATLPASLSGTHRPSGRKIEVRLAAWRSLRDPTRFIAVAFGAGDHRVRTEDRPPPPALSPGDRLELGPLGAVVERLLDHPRLIALRFLADRQAFFDGLARHGRPIQYAHVAEPLALWDVWTPIAANPIAFEAPSAGFALDWRTLATWRQRGIGFATLTHAAGLSSTGDPALDQRLPFDEPYRISANTAAAIGRTKAKGGRIAAVGTTVVRALESAANADGSVRAGDGVARGRIGGGTRLRVVDSILTGVHRPGESHFELLRAFADDAVLARVAGTLASRGYRSHEFGDSVLIERQPRTTRSDPAEPGAVRLY